LVQFSHRAAVSAEIVDEASVALAASIGDEDIEVFSREIVVKDIKQ
jgi:hypothetical protein